MKYRLVVGEKGNEQGHIIPTQHKSYSGAKMQFGKELAKYKGEGWGYVERDLYDDGRWERL